jgi:hypothetical protein
MTNKLNKKKQQNIQLTERAGEMAKYLEELGYGA